MLDSDKTEVRNSAGIPRRKLLKLAGVGIVGSGVSTSSVSAEEHVVEVEDSIQDAIDSAVSGSIVEIPNGTYAEAITIDKQLTVRAPDGANLTDLI